MERTFFKKNREKLKRDLQNGEMIILSSGEEKIFSSDSSYKFRVNKNFYYYTGIIYDNVHYLVLKQNDIIIEKLFFDEVSEKMKKWIGSKYNSKLAVEEFEIDDEYILPTERLIKEVKKDCGIHEIKHVYLEKSASLENPLKWSMGENLNIKYSSVTDFSYKHRLVKEECEINQIQKAIDNTAIALKMCMKNIRNCKNECELEAYLEFAIRRQGIKNQGFIPIIASGNNATTLHYIENNSDIDGGDLVLFDVGYEYEMYTSDISRVLPSTGKFNDEQKEVYDIVLKANKKVIDNVRPGITLYDLQNIAKKVLAEETMKAGIIDDENQLETIYFHSVSHMLGLDAHDCSDVEEIKLSTIPLKEGMVITVEPGLYIKDMRIGIRIEDDVLVTSDGGRVLSEKIPKDIEKIESSI